MTASDIVKLLNDWLPVDYDAFLAWTWGMRAKCNSKLVHHPHVRVRSQEASEDCYVTPLGILNGLLSATGSKQLVGAQFGPSSELQRFVLIDASPPEQE